MKHSATPADDGPPHASDEPAPYAALKDESTAAPSSSSSLPLLSSLQRIPKRYILCTLILLSNILCYADRTNITIAVLPGNIPCLQTDFETGQVLAAFFYGYVVTQFIGGLLANRYGGKAVLLCGVAVWIVCDAMTVPASSSFPLLLMARVGMGLGEGVNFPSDHAMVAAWFVQEERSGMLAIVSAGVDIGTIVSSGISPIIEHEMGWKWIYALYCLLGLCWLAAFALLGSSKPEWHPTISAEERNFIIRNRGSALHDATASEESATAAAPHAASSLLPSSSSSSSSSSASASRGAGCWWWFHSLLFPPDHPVPWRQLFASRSLYGIILAHFFFNYGFYVMLSWLPRYYVSRGTSLAEGGFLSISLPYIAGAIGGPFSGWLSNHLIRHRRWRILHVRLLMNTVGSVGASLSMFIIAFHPPEATSAATAVLTLGYFFFRFSFSGYWANMVDIAHAHAGSVMGISNTIATVPGMIGNTLTGLILDETGQWGLVFFLAGAAYVLAGVTFWLLADDVDIGDADVRHRKHRLETDKQSDEVQYEDATEDEAEDGAISRAINFNAAYR